MCVRLCAARHEAGAGLRSPAKAVRLGLNAGPGCEVAGDGAAVAGHGGRGGVDFPRSAAPGRGRRGGEPQDVALLTAVSMSFALAAATTERFKHLAGEAGPLAGLGALPCLRAAGRGQDRPGAGLREERVQQHRPRVPRPQRPLRRQMPPAAPAAGPPTWPPSRRRRRGPQRGRGCLHIPEGRRDHTTPAEPSASAASIRADADIHGTRRSPGYWPGLISYFRVASA